MVNWLLLLKPLLSLKIVYSGTYMRSVYTNYKRKYLIFHLCWYFSVQLVSVLR